MKYELIELRKADTTDGNVALIKRGTKYPEYAVVRNLDANKDMENDDCWDWTVDYWEATVNGLYLAIDCIKRLTEPGYIGRDRLEELATKFKDGLIDDDEEQAQIYFYEECEMTDKELEFFGVEISDEFKEVIGRY